MPTKEQGAPEMNSTKPFVVVNCDAELKMCADGSSVLMPTHKELSRLIQACRAEYQGAEQISRATIHLLPFMVAP